MEPTAPNMPSAEFRRQISIGELMTHAPYTIGSDQTLAAAHRMMREHGLRHLPVLRGGRLVGVLTQRDLYFLETISGVDVAIDKVADAMSPEVYTVAPEAQLRDVARTMADRKLGCAVVVYKGQVVGIFTSIDALRHLADALG
jgi:acetoin utilization protein AcuB